jgi:hypothetical protein
MLVEAVNWPSGRYHSEERILAAPGSAHYVTGWPQRDDLGVIAEAGGQPIGAAWLRFFTSNDPGYGFVSLDIPELPVGVAASWRCCGIRYLIHDDGDFRGPRAPV